MTTRKDDDPHAFRDPDFDAQWREASREEPPASLDATIRAAARREVGAGPQSSKASEAPRARRWTPLAIAATLGAVTFGVLQLVSTDRLGPTAGEKGVVTDMPAQAAKPSTDSNVPDAKPAEKAPASIAPSKEESMSAKRTESRPRSAAPPSGAPSAGGAPAAPAQSATANAEIAAAPPPIAARPDAQAGRPPPPTEEPHRRPLPVPESDTDKREAMRDERPALPQPFPSSPARIPAPAAPAAPAPPVASAPPSFAPQRLQEGATLRAAPAASAPTGRIADRSANAELAKERANLSVDDWIARIRRLRDEGKTTEVAKELEAFRTAHPDHERLLPPDLRNWPPPAQ